MNGILQKEALLWRQKELRAQVLQEEALLMFICFEEACPFWDRGCKISVDECPMQSHDEPRNDVVGNERMLYGDDD